MINTSKRFGIKELEGLNEIWWNRFINGKHFEFKWDLNDNTVTVYEIRSYSGDIVHIISI